jgi:hypothetical protein
LGRSHTLKGKIMGIKFTSSAGGAKKTTLEQYTYKNGDNSVRMFGDLLPRYIYWIKGENDKNIPMECLSFDRQKEAFINEEKDWVREYYPDLKCGWSYSIQCIDNTDGKAKVLNLKKKLMDQILIAAEDLGDPCDPETGWDIHFKRTKTGPNVYNVEYTLNTLKCQKSIRALSDEEQEIVSKATPIDELLPRPTPDAQKELLERVMTGGNESNTDESIEDEFDIA